MQSILNYRRNGKLARWRGRFAKKDAGKRMSASVLVPISHISLNGHLLYLPRPTIRITWAIDNIFRVGGLIPASRHEIFLVLGEWRDGIDA